MAFLYSISIIGLGATLFLFFDNVKFGAWWVGVIIFLSLFFNWRVYLRFYVSLFTLVAVLTGSVIEITNAKHFKSINACASQYDINSDVVYYGNPSSYDDAKSCLFNGATVVSNGCYCVSSRPRSCNEYTLSSYSKNQGYDCGSIMNKYSGIMIASCVMISLMLCLSLMRCLHSCYLSILVLSNKPIGEDESI